MSTDIVKLDLFYGGSFKHWKKKPWLNLVNVSSSEITILFVVTTSSLLCRIYSSTYIKTIPLLVKFGKLSRNASSWKTQQVRNLLFLNLTYNTGRYLAQNTYAKVIGNLMYAMTCTIPDIAYVVGRLSRHTSSPEYSGDPSVLVGYTDASWITDHEDYASTSEWIFTLGGGAVSWGLKKYSCLTDSTMASEFVALALCYKEAEWLRDFYENNLDKVYLSECGSEAASYELIGLALKHSEKPRYRPKASFNGSAQSGLNEREEGYV
ncbi:hypothetical protein Tco_1269083 [Tanacetum coccineum]